MTLEERKDIPGTYVVISGPNTYHVDARDPFAVSCDCPSGCWNETVVCRHVREVLALMHGEPEPLD